MKTSQADYENWAFENRDNNTPNQNSSLSQSTVNQHYEYPLRKDRMRITEADYENLQFENRDNNTPNQNVSLSQSTVNQRYEFPLRRARP
jgi:hypothetical protein